VVSSPCLIAAKALCSSSPVEGQAVQKVLLTGAGGFLGRHCLTGLTARGAEVHAVGRSGSGAQTGIRFHRADLLDPAQVADLVARVRPTHLLHLAWVTAPATYRTSPENLRWVQTSLALLHAFAEHGGRRALLVGSCAEYDWNAGLCREADTPLRPACLYGTCKNALRQMLEAFASQAGFSAAWARVFFLYGPHEHPDRLVASVSRALLAGEPALCSAGSQRRDFLHVADAAEALLALLGSDLQGAVNIGSGQAVAVADVVRRLANTLGRPDLLRLGERPAPGPPAAPLVCADVGRLRQELGWAPRRDLEQGLAQTLAWWRAHERCAA
jgi:nucleoside-diphosphate-sugar epimerase